MVTFFLVAPFILFILGTFIYIRVFQWEWAICNPELAAGFIAASVLIAGLFSALGTLYTMRRNRMAEMAMRILELWVGGTILEARALHHEIIEIKKQDFSKTVKDYKRHHLQLYYKLGAIPDLLEFTGWLAREKCISTKWLDDLLPVEEFYTDWEKLIKGAQEEQGKIKKGEEPIDKADAYFGNFVWLTKKIQELHPSGRH